MDLYHITLFVHILTLIVAASATAIVKLAIGRRARARTVGEALDWNSVLNGTAKLFPMCLAAFVITGGYMLSVNKVPIWSTGFIVAGLVGVALLLVSGVFLATKGRAVTQMLEEMATRGADQPAPRLVPPPVVAVLPTVNTGIALSVAFDMVAKPTSIPIALSVVAIGIVLGVATAPRRAAPAMEGMTAA
jgi:hypothetical protein